MTGPADHRRDIAGRADIDHLVRAFYERALVDPVLAPAFETLAVIGLDAHLPVVADFWEQILFRTARYQGAFAGVHEALNRQHGLAGATLARWLQVWRATVDELFAGPDADRAKSKAVAMAAALERGWRRGT
ncbi:group III truncated hemoglobin [Rhodococcus sp. SGAir0479]|uniref:group III truncated hemoglobin n=1 Tax=Rhodococcus sp. SGAir0479 TaxID=2567884 RepID=UPI0010CD5AD3|nr:group III truncated hemoglobin [Rhodococcus sp. SGAir0479]QCQ92038.1 group III truncated hemoglobin [Rhodococcus sp. SGAir0479]